MMTRNKSIDSLIEENELLREKYRLLQHKERHLQIINDFATSLVLQNTVEEIVWDIAKNVIARLGYLDCVVYLVNESKEYLIQRAAHGPKNPVDLDIYNPIKIKIGEGIVGTVAKTGVPELITDTSKDGRYILDDCARLSEIAVPIITNKNEVIGVIDSEHPERGFYTEEDVKLLQTISSIAASKLLQAKAQEHLKRSNRELEQFAYIASHDLQEPLRMVISYAQLLDRGYKNNLDENGQEFLGYMVEGAKRMHQLINDLLAFSTLSYKKRQRKVKNTDCNEVLTIVLNNLKASIQENEVQIDSYQLPIVKADFSQMVQLLQNLLSNAIKFRQKGQQPRIEIRVIETYPYYRFSVADNGIGIEPEFQEKVFSIFKRLHSRKKYEGTGIGLAICKKIVENFGGKIGVERNLAGGSTFWFTIPM